MRLSQVFRRRTDGAQPGAINQETSRTEEDCSNVHGRHYSVSQSVELNCNDLSSAEILNTVVYTDR